MATQEHEISKGWPFGLEIMKARLQVLESRQQQTAPAAADQPYSIQVRSISFSSFSSSNLDTESTASFFQDHSVSLGKLIGFKAGEGRRSFYFPNGFHFEEGNQKISVRGGTFSNMGMNTTEPHQHGVHTSAGICIPLLHKMSRSRSKPRH
ncbi:uncharacterized protein LOC123218636 [Mangifera indica]|uniref:uncharacterized protein LOC123218636 n=1 Tax=Mangifera indica TaxID=29780 RepID=UPI001CF95FD8|nr:uncharacterized protein LOC123218636 [Mangifera indica]